MIRVHGRCPRGCGETLFLSDDGYITCSWHACPDPVAAYALLQHADDAREGICTVFDHDGNYVGCIGAEKWRGLLAEARAANSQSVPRP